MKISRISHVAIGVRDMDAALRFYRDVLGMNVSLDRVEEFPQANGQPHAQRRGVYLRWDDDPQSTFIVLDQQITRPTVGEPAQIFQAGLHHYGFWVDDLDEVMTRMRNAGVDVILGGQGEGADAIWYGEPAGSSSIRSAIVRDFEGNYVQFEQRVR